MSKPEEELQAIVKTQKQQLLRYETRLKDVVFAYKGLLKEKAGLEQAFLALKDAKPSPKKEKPDSSEASSAPDNGNPSAETAETHDGHDERLETLMNSLATLSSEKSRMEATFQTNHKQLRAECAAKDKTIKELNDKLKEASLQTNIDIENLKSKFIVERHRRDKEYNDTMLMVRELQKLLADERHMKENLEMQLNDLKVQFSGSNFSDRAIKQLNAEMDLAKKKLKYYESNASNDRENSQLVQQLRNEIASLKQQHATALKSEQTRTFAAEERNKQLAAEAEQQVSILEAKICELSQTIGTYDRLRQTDKESILSLKTKLATKMDNLQAQTSTKETPADPSTKPRQQQNVAAIIDEILHLKNILVIENAKLDNPLDMQKLFHTATGNSNEMDETISLDEYEQVKSSHLQLEIENSALKSTLETQRTHIKTLKEKVKTLNNQIEDHELEMKNRNIEHTSELRAETSKWKEMVSAMEVDFRSKISYLEQNLQKQRDTALGLLEEKENEIKTLKTSFEIFLPGRAGSVSDGQEGGADDAKPTHQLGTILNANNGAGAGVSHDSFHMLHYAHELARKDIEISNLRKAKHSIDTSLRMALQDKVTSQELLHNRIADLEDEVENYKRYKSREGANMEYLKNVVLRFLTTVDDPEGRRKMLNAISQILQFSPAEMKTISICK